MSKYVESLLNSKRVLLLQGPMGDFFTRLAKWLNEQNIECFKINFNKGDQYFSKTMQNCFGYTDTLENFSFWLEQFVIEHQIDTIVCFGDCRFYHVIAKEVSLQCQINFFAFEEGYVRPNYITFEKDGVNFYSNFNDAFAAGYSLKKSSIEEAIEIVEPVDNQFSIMVLSAILYYWFWAIGHKDYPHYQHHRQIAPKRELYYWFISGLRRIKNYFVEKLSFKRFIQQHSKQYFVFALQVHNDSQILTHSDLKSVELYIKKVMNSFAQYADKDHHLVLKHHPMDRGYRDYSKLIKELEEKLNIVGRVHYFCDVHLPTLLKHSLGMVTVNSTTGIQALYHQIPVKTLGHAIYNLPDLTNQYPLQNFWKDPGVVDIVYFYNFRSRLIHYSQLNGSFYGKSPWMKKKYK